MKVEKKQSRESVLDKAKKLAISKAVDQYAKSYEEKTGKTVNAEALKSIFIQHADVVENVMTKGGLDLFVANKKQGRPLRGRPCLHIFAVGI